MYNERKPIGVTAPYRKVQPKTVEQLEKEVVDLTKRVELLEKRHAKEKQVQTKSNSG